MSWTLVRGRVGFAAMMSFAADPRVLAGLVPSGTEVDTYDGSARLSVVGMQFTDNRILGVPILFARSYDQISLRFYVKRQLSDTESRRGVVVVHELAPVSPLVSFGHLLYGEAYERLPVTSRVRPPDPNAARLGRATYRWRTDEHVHRLTVDFDGEPALPSPDSQEAFLVDRHWVYVAHHADQTREYCVDHPPWRVWSAAQARLSPEVYLIFGDRFAHVLSQPPVSTLVAEGSRVDVHRPVTIAPAAKGRLARQRV